MTDQEQADRIAAKLTGTFCIGAKVKIRGNETVCIIRERHGNNKGWCLNYPSGIEGNVPWIDAGLEWAE